MTVLRVIGGPTVIIFITPRLHGPYQVALANKNSQKHLIFPISGILTTSEGGVTQVSTFEVIGGEGPGRGIVVNTVAFSCGW
jgi:hypothetical protein